MNFKQQYDALMKEYADAYDLSTLNSANDKTNLEMLVRNSVIAKQLQSDITELANNAGENIAEIKKLSDAVKDLMDRNMQLERQLGIDRKSRKKDSESTTGEYILMLKDAAHAFLEKRLVKVYCPECNIMVGRIAPVHEHTSFSAFFQCSQCQKAVIITRESKDVFFDLAHDDQEWRRKYPVEIKQPKQKKAIARKASFDDDPDAVEAELIIEDEDE